MNKLPRNSNSAFPTSVHVEVKGSLDIPLHLGMLADLGDPIMEQEILKEAVRIAVSEKIGYFDGLDVRLCPSSHHKGTPTKPNGKQYMQHLTESPRATATAAATTQSYARRYCEVDVDLQRLGNCIEAIQKAYEDLLAQVHVLQEVLSWTGPFSNPLCHPSVVDVNQRQQQQPSVSSSSANPLTPDALMGSARLPQDGMLGNTNTSNFNAGNTSNSLPVTEASAPAQYADAVQRLTAARRIIEEILQGRSPDVKSEAAVLSETQRMQREVGMLYHEQEKRHPFNGNKPNVFCDRGGEADALPLNTHMEHEVGVDAELRRGLLADDDEDVSDHVQGANTSEDEPDDDELDEEAMHDRYLKEGYIPL